MINISNNIISIDNYKQINSIENDLIKLNDIIIIGNNLKIIELTPYTIMIKGKINKLEFR